MSMMPPPLKQTLPPEQVINFFLSFRQASAELVISSRVTIRPVVRVRHELMWLLRDLTYLSLAEIGRWIGGRDATTVQHGVDQISDQIAADPDYRREMLFQRTNVLRLARSGMAPELRLTAARGVLADASLPDADARSAALQLLGDRDA
jgi:hypothetical protein